MRLRTLGLTIALCVTALSAHAQEQERAIYFTGAGQKSCSDWLAARETQDVPSSTQMVQWVAGFSAASSYYTNYDTRGGDMNAIRFWLDKYCKDNPLSPSLMLAAAQYAQETGGPVAAHNKPRPTPAKKR
jgi:hypothetical protein